MSVFAICLSPCDPPHLRLPVRMYHYQPKLITPVLPSPRFILCGEQAAVMIFILSWWWYISWVEWRRSAYYDSIAADKEGQKESLIPRRCLLDPSPTFPQFLVHFFNSLRTAELFWVLQFSLRYGPRWYQLLGISSSALCNRVVDITSHCCSHSRMRRSWFMQMRLLSVFTGPFRFGQSRR